jgi:hypothetical protein
VLAQPEPPAPETPAPISHLRDPEATVYW